MSKPLQPSTSNFRDLIEGGFLYVDKTEQIYDLVQESKGLYFLSRPRRFGKSLFISTLAEIFAGNKELFQNLWLYESDYQWESYSVIRLDFSRNTVRNATRLEEMIDYYVEEIARGYGLTLRGFDYQSRFDNLILQLAEEKRVVVLIDEYDKPILDNITNIKEAVRIRDTLQAFYTVLKAMESHIRFLCITGISKFSRVGVFSALNNLTDLTMSPRAATLVGLTEQELRENFQDYITDFAQELGLSEDDLLTRMKYWYDGFRFTPREESVYNPYSVLNLFYHKHFSDYWFESGTPSFLLKLIKEYNYEVDLFEELVAREVDFSTYEIEHLEIVPLLFQTGYITIIKSEIAPSYETIYTLSYPNFEVRNAFLTHLLQAFTTIDRTVSRSHLRRLMSALRENQIQTVFDIFAVFFANIPYNVQTKKEQYYQSIFYVVFMMLGTEIDVEVHTNQGRIDAVIELADRIFLFEFKLNKSAKDALDQIKNRKYYQKYCLQGKPITCIGANFDMETRTINEWDDMEIEADRNNG